MTQTGLVNLVEGVALVHVGSGGQAQTRATGDTIVNGAKVKLNCK